ncbi:MAG: phosphoribosylglycinamide formyltransferase [Marinifilaceae bacterium]
MINISIFASGSGSNAENIIRFLQNNDQISVNSVFCNNADAYVLERAKNFNVPAFVFNRNEMRNPEALLKHLKELDTDYIILAGFLWLMPAHIIEAFPNRIINIHPALLPNYGGKGMYGMNVHNAVIEAGEKESGITIHFVNEHYDSGATIFQATCPITAQDTPDTLAEKVHALEYEYFPKVIEQVILDQNNK